MKTTNAYEQQAWLQQHLLIGIDEAGRGPLAGPLVVAGVIFPIGYDSKDIYDSKKLSEKKREELFEVIINDALYYDIRIVPVEFIDLHNIYRATQLTMTAIANEAPCSLVLTDAMKLPCANKKTIDIIKGDQLSCSIAAGSILAKVTRDQIMYDLDEKYPQYHFKKNKGYPTKDHLEALKEHGILTIHRKSYRPVMESMQTSLF